MDPISKVIRLHHLTWCGSHKVVSLSLKQRVAVSL